MSGKIFRRILMSMLFVLFGAAGFAIWIDNAAIPHTDWVIRLACIAVASIPVAIAIIMVVFTWSEP